MITILEILGSPRKNGNSETLCNAFLDEAKTAGLNVETIRLNKLDISPCKACDACSKSGRCPVNDDMQVIYPAIEKAAAIVLSSPIYFGSLSGQTKIFIDRFQCWWNAKYRLNQPFVNKQEHRPAFFLSVGAVKNNQYHQNATEIARIFFSVINYKFQGSLSYQGFDHPDSIKNSPEIIKEVHQAGKKFAQKIIDNQKKE